MNMQDLTKPQKAALKHIPRDRWIDSMPVPVTPSTMAALVVKGYIQVQGSFYKRLR